MDPSTYEYLEPTDDQKKVMSDLRKAAGEYSTILEKLLPEGPDKTFTLRNHRTTAMWANVALTRASDGTPRN